MRIRTISIGPGMVTLAVIFLLASTPTFGQTPDGETPAEETICDILLQPGVTPGLYGLCVAFCEAQDCEPDLSAENPFEGCVAGSPKVLANYRKKMRDGDPDMSCIQAPCPCWSEEELAGLDYVEHGGNAYPDFEVLSYGGVGSSTGGPGPNRTNGEPVGRLEPVKQT